MPATLQAPNNALARLRDTVLQTLDHADRHPALLLTLVLLVDVLVALRSSLDLPMWHDELFTYSISQASTLRDLMQQISTIDLNPPLSYLLTRASFHLFGVGTLQCRLPEMIGFLLALVATFFFVRKRAGNSFGVMASAMLLSSLAGEATIQARPYGLMMGFTALALLAWQSSSVAEEEGRRSWVYDLLLMVVLALLLLSHVFGLLGWATIAIAEGVSALKRGRISRLRTLALAPPLAVTLLYAPLLRDHGSSLFPAAFQPHLFTIFNFYVAALTDGAIALWLTAVTLILLGKRDWLRGGTDFSFTVPEWAASSALLLVPALLMIRLMLQHAAFFSRYGLLTCLGTTMLFTATFQWCTKGRPAAALIAAVFVLFISGRLTFAARAALGGHVLRHAEPAAVPFHLEDLPDQSLPIVDASGLAFVEMNYQETPSILSRTWYLTGGDAALQYAHATIFESMAVEKQIFHFGANVDTFQHFTSLHKHFYVVGTIDYPEDWLLRKLMADGATLTLRRRTPGPYRDSDIYDVTLQK
jgi:hypothetical protein